MAIATLTAKKKLPGLERRVFFVFALLFLKLVGAFFFVFFCGSLGWFGDFFYQFGCAKKRVILDTSEASAGDRPFAWIRIPKELREGSDRVSSPNKRALGGVALGRGHFFQCFFLLFPFFCNTL